MRFPVGHLPALLRSIIPVNPALAVSGIMLVMLTGLYACDSAISGDPAANQPPDTYLSVRDTSLVDNLASAERLASTVYVAWSGTDPDGFVSVFEMRLVDSSNLPAIDNEMGWGTTTARDTLVLLPIEEGSSTADVAVQVRAVDNEGLKDPSPASTIYPVRNSPPTIRLGSFDLPPEESFPIFSFSWDADDPEGPDNIDRIDISLNDSTRFVALPPEVEFATFVGVIDAGDPTQAVAEARVYTGRGFERTDIFVPDLRLNDENVFYVRAVDKTDTTSAIQSHEFFVRTVTSDLLFVNDVRIETAPKLQSFHLNLLRSYLPTGTRIDIWDLTQPYQSGSTRISVRSDALPAVADPTIRRILAQYRYIYWISSNTTNSVASNNLPFAASAMDLFFENGGKLMVHTPISLPTNEEANLGNPAILLLPLTGLIEFPDSLRPSLRLPARSVLEPVEELPNIETQIPPIEVPSLLIGTLPYTEGAGNIPLLKAPYQYLTQDGSRGDWTGSQTVASISGDLRVALVALPLVDDRTGLDLLRLADGSFGSASRAVVYPMLESLGFPKR